MRWLLPSQHLRAGRKKSSKSKLPRPPRSLPVPPIADEAIASLPLSDDRGPPDVTISHVCDVTNSSPSKAAPGGTISDNWGSPSVTTAAAPISTGSTLAIERGPPANALSDVQDPPGITILAGFAASKLATEWGSPAGTLSDDWGPPSATISHALSVTTANPSVVRDHFLPDFPPTPLVSVAPLPLPPSRPSPLPPNLQHLQQLADLAGLARPVFLPHKRPNTDINFPVFDPSDVTAAPSPLQAEVWEALLRDYPDRRFVSNIVGIIKHGAKLGYSGDLREAGRPSAGVRNLPMDGDSLDHVRNTIASRVSSGYTRKVSECPPNGAYVCSPIGTVPKRNGKLRTINHLSWPRRKHTSVNDGIKDEDASLVYETLDPFMAELKQLHAICTMFGWKTDLMDAYYHVMVASRDAGMLGYRFEGEDYYDCTLNFGGKSSPKIFNLFAEGLHWILESFGLRVHHYLDDNFGASDPSMGQPVLDFISAVCGALGLKVSPEKSKAAQEIEILGIQFDLANYKAWISPERKTELLDRLKYVLSQRTVPKSEIESLAGMLQFVSRVCPPGRAFLADFYNCVKKVHGKSRNYPVGIKSNDKLSMELAWWSTTLRKWDGVRLLHQPIGTRHIWSDAATSKGIGAHLGPPEACEAAFAQVIKKAYDFDKVYEHDIMVLEAMALSVALEKWGSRLQHHEVVCHVDNTVLESAIRTGRCRHQQTQTIIRRIFRSAIVHDLTLVPVWLPSKENVVADALSRFDITTLQTWFPAVYHVAELPSDLPPHITSPRIVSTYRISQKYRGYANDEPDTLDNLLAMDAFVPDDDDDFAANSDKEAGAGTSRVD